MNKILQGDSLEVLKTLPEKSINMCMTSPPYWALRDYGTASWQGGDKNCDHKEAKEKSRYDYDLSKAQTGTHSGAKKGTDQARWKDECPKCGARKVDKQLGLEPTFNEYINKLCDIFDEVKRVLRDGGTCWINLGDTYFAKRSPDKEVNKINPNQKSGHPIKVIEQGLQSKCLTMIPFRFAVEMVNRGWILRNTIIWHKPNCMPSSVKDRFTVDFEYLFFFSKNKKYYFETQYEPFKGKDEKKWKGNYDKVGSIIQGSSNAGIKRTKRYGLENGRNKRTVWIINPKPFKEAHFAVFPEELCVTPIKAGCPKDGIVLDPFFGAGTTGLVALKQGKNFLGIELNKEYIKIAQERLKPFLEQKLLGNENDKK